MLWSIIDASPLPIVTIDALDCITGWNPAAQRLFGWTAAEVIGRTCPTVPESEKTDYQLHILKQLGGSAIQGEEVIRRRKDGVMLHLGLWTSPLADASGNIVGAVGIFAGSLHGGSDGIRRLITRIAEIGQR